MTAKELRDKIQHAEMRLARCGDEWLQRAARADITAMRRQLKTLEEQKEG